MSELVVLQPGMWTTVQDHGRPGLASLGVARAGAADALSLLLGNRLVGNGDEAAALEFTLVGGTLQCDGELVIALTGAPLTAALERPRAPARPLPRYTAVHLRAGDTLRVGGSPWGVRAYLCVRGGVDVMPVLGSRATHVASALGGAHGRPLRAGDRLPLGKAPSRARAHTFAPDFAHEVDDWLRAPVLRATDAAHTALFTPDARAAFWREPFTVSDRSDRAGCRLAGPHLAPPGDGRLPSEGMPLGAVEVPGQGEVIVLGVDGPTTGGYPTIACLAAVDLARLGQLRPREVVRFVQVTRAQARALLAERQAWVDRALPPA